MTPHRRIPFANDIRGVTAVEFALIAPLMISILLGMVEVTNLTTSYGKAVSAAQTVADLTTQSSTLTTAQISSIVVAAQRVLDPLPSDTTTLSVDISSIAFDVNDAPYQAWTYHWGKASTPPAPSLAAGLGAANESVVIATLSYTCTPLFHQILPTATFTQTAVSRPRITNKIALNGVTG